MGIETERGDPRGWAPARPRNRWGEYVLLSVAPPSVSLSLGRLCFADTEGGMQVEVFQQLHNGQALDGRHGLPYRRLSGTVLCKRDGHVCLRPLAHISSNTRRPKAVGKRGWPH
eukprot:gene2388-26609_t